MNVSKPEWVKPTPRDNYAKGVNDAGVYIAFGREMPELPGVDNFHKPMKKKPRLGRRHGRPVLRRQFAA